ncbi:LysR family transcriptional regulator [Rhodoferax sp. PAMC 29310]|uniref:LysR family transcriptional regulator n=1 Tax=Rhodoferax sp. PAMC 29310 TaxID=2822760 RepID=UPI001B32D66B|nr:LysR family transcriptional regulator [Rhodoferax sp. PAMC 29310]
MNLLPSLRYLVALHEHQHFGRAALACHITQPALSNALRALESEFGVVIIRRDRAYAGFTPEGERVLTLARLMLHEYAVLQDDLKSRLDAPQGTLRLGAVPTAMPIAARFATQMKARHPGIVPVVLSSTSTGLEQGLEDLTLDLALGYPDRLDLKDSRLKVWPQYTEHYFLLRRSNKLAPDGLQMAPSMTWREAAALPLCLLTPDMHNRQIVNAAFASAGVSVQPAMETNSILTMVLSVVEGSLCSVLPGSLVATLRHERELEALPLVGPDVATPICFMSHASARASCALEAALVLAQDEDWLRHAAVHSGLLGALPAP